MELAIQGRNLQVSDRLREYVTKKTARLQRHLSAVTSVKVEFTEENTRSEEQRLLVQMTVDVHGSILAGEERGSTPTPPSTCSWISWTAVSSGTRASCIRQSRPSGTERPRRASSLASRQKALDSSQR